MALKRQEGGQKYDSDRSYAGAIGRPTEDSVRVMFAAVIVRKGEEMAVFAVGAEGVRQQLISIMS